MFVTTNRPQLLQYNSEISNFTAVFEQSLRKDKFGGCHHRIKHWCHSALCRWSRALL